MALLHMLKAEAWPLAPDAQRWQAERVLSGGKQRKFSPSMRQRIEIAGLYSDALAGLPETWTGSCLCRWRIGAR